MKTGQAVPSRVAKLLAALAGLGLLGVVELVLQLAGAGPANNLFVPERRGQPQVYAINPLVAHRFFQPQHRRQVSTPASFSRQKEPGTVRIFALGESTLLGFPNPAYASFPAFLALMLEDRFPERDFEVLNCGITAINSFCVLDFMEEVVEYQPDLVLLYTGHNEFIGPYGITTPFLRFGNNRTLIRLHMLLQRSKIYYYLKELIHRLHPEEEVNFGMHLVDKEVGLFDPGYRITGENYRANLEEMLETARGRGVPVLLSTLVANVKDFHPLRSECDGTEPALQLEELLRQGRLQEAQRIGALALADHPDCANLHFNTGQLYLRLADYQAARQEFTLARDLDRLPFRAPAQFNQIIQELAGSAAGEVLLCDVEEAFSAHSPHGLIGDELITEYLHPTVYGHYLIARSMAQSLEQSALGQGWGRTAGEGLKDYETCAQQLGYTLWDEVLYRNDLILFLRKMPYRELPLVLRRRLADLMRDQLRDVPRLAPAARRQFREKGGLEFLRRMQEVLLPEDRHLLEKGLRQLEGQL